MSQAEEDKQAIILDYAQRFGTEVFVETGTNKGDMAKAMLDSQQFKQIHTIDLFLDRAEAAHRRFKYFTHVHCWKGDSAERLAPIVKGIQHPILFWLSAHHGDPRFNGAGPGTSPVLAELDAIAGHSHADQHVVLIDGEHVYARKSHKYREYTKLGQIKACVEQHWPDWQFQVIDDVIRCHRREDA